MRKRLVVFLAVLVALHAWPGVSSGRDVKVRMKRGKGAPTRQAQVPDMRKPFKQVVQGMDKIEGLFTFYWHKESGKLYMEIKPDQLDVIYLCSITREAGDGQFFDSGAQLREFPFVFVKVGHKIQFIHKNVYYRAEEGKPIVKALERGLSDSVIGTADIVAKPNPKGGGLLVSPSAFFLKDVGYVSYILGELAKLGFSFDRENSYFSEVKAFPQNCELETVVHFKGRKPGSFAALPEGQSMMHRYHFSLSTLPETGYRPRLADDRVGHFVTMYQDYTDVEKDTPYVRYINRWQLEKAEPAAKISKPKEPIVFWLENTIPEQYREAVREGVLRWNKAFKAAGFRDAIVVKQMPADADWDPADVRYNTIRWIVNPGGGYAVGPSRTNPFTGQIYDADIRISADIVRFAYVRFEEMVDVIRQLRLLPSPSNPLMDSTGPFGVLRRPAIAPSGIAFESLDMSALQKTCNYAEGLRREAGFGLALLEARGLLAGRSAKAQHYIEDYIADLVAHEVGHTLGLRHNFKGSSIRSVNEMQDVRLTSKQGLTGSVMDYNPVNLAPKGKRQGEYWQTELGPYDVWAIEYAYTPIPEAETPEDELPALEKIASRVAEAELAYGTDEDAFSFDPRGIDPTCNLWDLGSDPMDFYSWRVALVKELWDKIEDEFARPGVRYPKLRHAFQRGFTELMIAGMNCSKFIGGIYHRRDHVGDPGGRLPFEPVPAETQRQALEFLKKNYFSSDSFRFNPELVNKLAPERFWDFEGTIWRTIRIDYPIHDLVLAVQALPLARLYNPIVLSRLQDLPLHYGAGERAFTMEEMFRGVRNAIWSELEGARQVDSYRRSLQRLHLAILIHLAVSPTGGVPEDATTLARADLRTILKGLDRRLAGGALDAMTKAHWEECKARVEAALEAGLQRRAG